MRKPAKDYIVDFNKPIRSSKTKVPLNHIGKLSNGDMVFEILDKKAEYRVMILPMSEISNIENYTPVEDLHTSIFIYSHVNGKRYMSVGMLDTRDKLISEAKITYSCDGEWSIEPKEI